MKVWHTTDVDTPVESYNARVEWPANASRVDLVNYFSVTNGSMQENGAPEPILYLHAAHIAPPVLPDPEAIERFTEAGSVLPANVAASLAIPIDRAEELARLLLQNVAAYHEANSK